MGFSENFIELERSLLPKDVGAELSPQKKLLLLECMCGRVIRGECAGCEELFSPGGSFWINDFSDPDKISPRVRKRMRGTCLDEGFQSMALVPCRPDSESVALLHVCDTRKGLLSEELMASLEESGRHFAKLVFQLRELKKTESQSREAEKMQLRILVVDDEPEMASLVGNMLEAKGHQVTTVSGGLEALEVLSATRFDLVITDFNMPLMSGLGLAEEIWTRWHPFSPPVILMSGTSSEEVALREKGPPDVAAFLSKPFSVEDLMETVHAVVQ